MAVRPRDSLLVLFTLAAVIGASALHSAVAGQAADPALPRGPNRWTTRGPGGGTILAMAVDPTDPSTIYAGAWDYYEPFGSRVYKSTDGGPRSLTTPRGAAREPTQSACSSRWTERRAGRSPAAIWTTRLT